LAAEYSSFASLGLGNLFPVFLRFEHLSLRGKLEEKQRMNNPGPGEHLYREGLSKYESSLAMAAETREYNTLPREEAERRIEAQMAKETELQKESISLFEKALSTVLDERTEIQCRLKLGVVLFDMDLSFDFIVNSGLDNFPELRKAVTQLEQALALDAQRGTGIFTDRIPQSDVLQRLDVIWQRQSLYLKNQFGNDKKLSYLQEKLNLLDFLGGVKPAGLCLSFAFYYKDVRNRDLTLEWLRSAAAADDYGDLDSKSFFHNVAMDNKQRAEKGIREMSSQKVSSQKKVPQHGADKKTGGCFIATAVYGSPIAPEVIVFRGFRDDVLLRSLPGRIGISLYYLLSPPLASFIGKRPLIRRMTNAVLLQPILFVLKRGV
jgi:hypothetical protein